MIKGDIVRRVEEQPVPSCAWIHLSINTDYEVEYVLDNGLIVLKDFLMLVYPNEIIIL